MRLGFCMFVLLCFSRQDFSLFILQIRVASNSERDLSVSASGSAGTKGTTPSLAYIFLDWKGAREIFLQPLQKEIISHTFHLLGVHLCLTSPSLKCKFSLWTCKPHSHLIANYFGVLEYDQHLTDIGNLGMNKQFRVENGKFGWNRASGSVITHFFGKWEYTDILKFCLGEEQ